jgi:hypothetical protein
MELQGTVKKYLKLRHLQAVSEERNDSSYARTISAAN